MNPMIELLKNRRTYRNFAAYEMPKKDLEAIIASSKQAPSSMNIQYYSIIVVDDQAIKNTIYENNTRNPQIKECSVFLLFVMDFYRSYLASQKYGQPFEIAGNQDALLIGSIDAALAMENAIVAAEALGYQSCCIGGVRMIADKLSSLLQLPEYVYPICGLCIGKSKDLSSNKVKPRYQNNVFFNGYNQDQMASIEAYDAVMQAFAEQRETLVWSEKVGKQYATLATTTNDSLKNKKF